jgi:hypothetical protein
VLDRAQYIVGVVSIVREGDLVLDLAKATRSLADERTT